MQILFAWINKILKTHTALSVRKFKFYLAGKALDMSDPLLFMRSVLHYFSIDVMSLGTLSSSETQNRE